VTDAPDVPVAFRCPTCGAGVVANAPWRPFCCERCKWVDLGAWLSGRYKIEAQEDDDADAPPAAPAPDDDDAAR
jgi:endogenous inhibitor of DNA gyrase (YacG/DUF329 family)